MQHNNQTSADSRHQTVRQSLLAAGYDVTGLRVGKPSTGVAREIRLDRAAEKAIAIAVEARTAKPPVFEMKLVDGSWIQAIGYNEAAKLLRVELKSGETYEYAEVSLWEYNQLEKAESIGAHINKFVKPNHSFRKLPDDSANVAPLALLVNTDDDDPDPKAPVACRPAPAYSTLDLHGHRVRVPTAELNAFSRHSSGGSPSQDEWQDFLLEHGEARFNGEWIPISEALRLDDQAGAEQDEWDQLVTPRLLAYAHLAKEDAA